MKEWQTLMYEKIEGVARITLNRPEVYNFLNFQLISELDEAMKEAESDDDVRVVILAGAGTSFCGGHDLYPEGFQEIAESHRTPESTFENEKKMFFDKCLYIWNLDKPTIAQVQGHVFMAGFTLANMCDLIMASEDAKFHCPVVRLGNVSEEVFIEPWVMSARKAKEFLFVGEPMDAHEAQRVGVVNYVVPREKLAEETLGVAKKISQKPALALKLCKKAISHAMEIRGMRQALEYGFLAHTFIHSTDADREAFRRSEQDKGRLKNWIDRQLLA